MQYVKNMNCLYGPVTIRNKTKGIMARFIQIFCVLSLVGCAHNEVQALDVEAFGQRQIAHYQGYFNIHEKQFGWIAGELASAFDRDSYQNCLVELWKTELDAETLILQEINSNSDQYNVILFNKLKDGSWTVLQKNCNQSGILASKIVKSQEVLPVVKQLDNISGKFDTSNIDVFDGTIYFISHINRDEFKTSGGYALLSSDCPEFSDNICNKVSNLVKKIKALVTNK